MSVASTQFEQDLSLPPSLPRNQPRYDWLWAAVPLMIIVYLLTVTPVGLQHFTSFQPLKAWQPILIICAGMGLLLLMRGWVVRLPGKIAPSRLMQFNIGLCGGLMLFASSVMLARRTRPLDLFELAEWLFIEIICFLLVLGWLKSRSLPSQFADGRPCRDAVRPHLPDYITLTKMGLNGLVLFTTFVGYFMAASGPFNWFYLIRLLLGTGLVAWGSSALNQLMESDADALMRRTANRPLPAGRMTMQQAMGFGVALCLGGFLVLALTINILTAALAALTLAVYLFLYTPLKRINSLSTLAGAICGALPPVLGWGAAGFGIQTPAMVLFAILFLWQIPHFLAIAWKYREQYGRAGFPLYSVGDSVGRATAFQSLLYTLILISVSLLAIAFQIAGPLYLIAGGLLGLGMLASALLFQLRPTAQSASFLFYSSIIYLPLLLGIMLLDHKFAW